MLYRLLKAIVWLGVRLYYREIKVVNKHYLDVEGPAVIIANHPNTLMDAWMMGYANRRRVFFMAKATFFSSPFKRFLLGALGMIPINRKSDGVTKGVSNKDSFEACYSLLERGDILVVFPEGTSYLERKLRELKSGTARIALEVESRNQGTLNVKIIPIGLNYIDASSYRGKVMIHVGKPFEIEDGLLAQYQQNQGQAAKALTEQFRVALSRVFVSLETEENEQLAEDIAYILDGRKVRGKRGVSHSIDLFKLINSKLDEFRLVTPYKLDEIQKLTKELIRDLEGSGVRPDFLDRTYRSTMFSRQLIQSLLFLVITFPIFVFGVVQSCLPYFSIGWLLPKITKDEEYHAPLAILLGFVLYPLTYAGFILLAHYGFHLRGFWWVMYGVSLPFTGVFAHFYLRYKRHLGSKQRFARMVRKRKEFFTELKVRKERLKSLILGE